VTGKGYKRIGWARKAAAKLKSHTTHLCHDGLYRVRPMTAEEKKTCDLMKSVNSAMVAYMFPVIQGELNKESALYRALR
jgi:hypothetical protein